MYRNVDTPLTHTIPAGQPYGPPSSGQCDASSPTTPKQYSSASVLKLPGKVVGPLGALGDLSCETATASRTTTASGIGIATPDFSIEDKVVTLSQNDYQKAGWWALSGWPSCCCCGAGGEVVDRLQGRNPSGSRCLVERE